MDAEAMKSLKKAREMVDAAWRKTDEGKAEAKSQAKAAGKGSSIMDALTGFM